MPSIRFLAAIFLIAVFEPTAADINEEIFAAAESGHTSEVERLIKAGADVNTYRMYRIHGIGSNWDSKNALMMAAINGHSDVVQLLIDAGADIVWKGTMRSFGREGDDALFNSRHNCRKCNPVIDAHNGTGEACGYLDPAADRSGISTVGIHNRRLALALAMTFKKRDLPFVTNWQHWGNGEYVCALEPGTNPPIGRNAARKQRKLRHLAPGKSRTYELVIATAAGRGKCAALLGK